VTAATGTLPLPRRATVKLADYHCNSEPGKCPEEFLRLDSQRPDYLALHGQDFESVGSSACTSPHSIPESYSPPSIPATGVPGCGREENLLQTFFGAQQLRETSFPPSIQRHSGQ
ncbi:uncharacterized protein LOC116185695, partial [Apis dorsata]|uniref:uncharacterized protein LOC116185695 n=1 Tax=Apis dorsata TaxID=7462 RepID=UPI0012934409